MMNLGGQHIGVLIVGAGPSGLMMAAQLLRFGVQPVIIDSRKGPTQASKALAVQARSMEIFRQMGLADRILQDGKMVTGAVFFREGLNVASITFDDLDEAGTRFPFVEMYPQSKTERLLLDYLTQNCCPVYWDTTLVQIEQAQNYCTIKAKSAGLEVLFQTNWLIGADGAHSTTRKLLQIPFLGDTYASFFYLADVELKNEQLPGGHMSFFLGTRDFAALFPMPESRRYRIVGNVPHGFVADTDLQFGDILPKLENLSKFDLNVGRVNWFTTYHLHHRVAEKFISQNCFLIGDAAHIQSPVGGQGMNTGLQDAYNLAWKLAGVMNGQFGPAILESYAAERMPLAKDILNTTDKVFKLILAQNWLERVFKKWVLPKLIKWLWGSQNVRQAFFKKLSQIQTSYRDSDLNLHLSQKTKIKAGDRLPYLKVYDEKKAIETDLHEWCEKPGFTIIIIGKLTEDELFALARRISFTYEAGVHFYYLPPSNKNRPVFDAFEITARQCKTLVIRPDMYIGLVADGVDIKIIDNYLTGIVGWKKHHA